MDTTMVRDLIERALDGSDCFLYDLEFVANDLRVTLAANDGGPSVDELALLSRQIGNLLDEEDPIPGAYNLEVSSPGLDRKLRTPEHYAQAVGQRVTIKTHPHVEGARRIDGILTAADDEAITVEVSAERSSPGMPHVPDGDRTVPYIDIERARIVFEWGPQPKPNSPEAIAARRVARDRARAQQQSAKTELPETNEEMPT